ncbi:MAG: HD domain-containing phosphohydrolase [bacterium]|nr:HD domain-containing phosphohydrolase [bacterium]
MEETVAISKLEPPLEEEVLIKDLQDAIDHGILVSNLAVLIAKHLEMEDVFIYEIAIAGLLHDIGKLKLGKYLYGRREDTLAIEEMKYVRMHSAFSYQVLEKEQYSEFVLSTVYHHHENFDGSGYPDNLVGTAIPFGARILRCCDVFAALVSTRPYRAAFDVDTAVELMIDEVKNFDMRVFLAFLEVVHSSEFEKIRELVTLCNKAT